jgi:hypothetical protein
MEMTLAKGMTLLSAIATVAYSNSSASLSFAEGIAGKYRTAVKLPWFDELEFLIPSTETSATQNQSVTINLSLNRLLARVDKLSGYSRFSNSYSNAVYNSFLVKPGTSNPASSKLTRVVRNILSFARNIYASKSVFNSARYENYAQYEEIFGSPLFESFVKSIMREDADELFSETNISENSSYYNVANRSADLVYKYFLLKPGSSNPASAKLMSVVRNILKFAKDIYSSKNVFYSNSESAEETQILNSPLFESFVKNIIREDADELFSETNISEGNTYYNVTNRGADSVYKYFLLKPGSSNPTSAKLTSVVRNILRFAQDIYSSKNMFVHSSVNSPEFEEFFSSPLFESFVKDVIRKDADEIFNETNITEGDTYYNVTNRGADAVYKHFLLKPGSSNPASAKLTSVVRNIMQIARNTMEQKNVFVHNDETEAAEQVVNSPDTSRYMLAQTMLNVLPMIFRNRQLRAMFDWSDNAVYAAFPELTDKREGSAIENTLHYSRLISEFRTMTQRLAHTQSLEIIQRLTTQRLYPQASLYLTSHSPNAEAPATTTTGNFNNMPDWAGNFLKSSFQNPQSSIATRQITTAEAPQTVWNAPQSAVSAMKSAPPVNMQYKSGDDTAKPQAFTQRDINKLADSVYKVIENRLTTERRRLGL